MFVKHGFKISTSIFPLQLYIYSTYQNTNIKNILSKFKKLLYLKEFMLELRKKLQRNPALEMVDRSYQRFD